MSETKRYNRECTEAEKYDLEKLIDHVGLESVLDAIGDICIAKADHIESMWQDKPLSERWNKIAATTFRGATLASGL